MEGRLINTMELLFNFPLWASLAAIVTAQILKIPINFFLIKKVDLQLLTSTGGMPSSHSGAVTALATAVALEEGLQSPIFAVASVVAVIVMYDATGVRRQAGEQAIALNQLITDFNRFIEEAKTWPDKEESQKREELKELLGHQPSEVFAGGLLGIVLTLILKSFLPL